MGKSDLQLGRGSLEAAFEVGGADVAAPHGSLDVLFKQPPVALQLVGRLFVQGVLGVRLLHQTIISIHTQNYVCIPKRDKQPYIYVPRPILTILG